MENKIEKILLDVFRAGQEAGNELILQEIDRLTEQINELKHLDALLSEAQEQLALYEYNAYYPEKFCPISHWLYNRKIDKENIETTLLHGEELESFLEWSKDRKRYYILLCYGQIGTNIIAVDEDRKEFKDITDYESW